MNQRLEDRKRRNVSRMAHRRAFHAEELHRNEAREYLARQTMRPRARVYRRAGVVILTAAVVVLGVVALFSVRGERPRPPVQSDRRNVAVEPPVSAAPVTSAKPIFTADPFVIRLRAVLPCRVRTTVDGISLDWRMLQKDDEIVARPRQEMLIESDDGGALSVTVNETAISIAPDRRAVAFRLAAESRFEQPIF